MEVDWVIMILETEAETEAREEAENTGTRGIETRRRYDGWGYRQTGRRLTVHIAIDSRFSGCP